jgi:hypothetical protein
MPALRLLSTASVNGRSNGGAQDPRVVRAAQAEDLEWLYLQRTPSWLSTCVLAVEK